MSILSNYHDGNLFVVVENDTTRVTAEGTAPFFDQISVWSKATKVYDGGITDVWTEEIVWDQAEWREKSNEAFEAILGVIAKVVAGQTVKAP